MKLARVLRYLGGGAIAVLLLTSGAHSEPPPAERGFQCKDVPNGPDDLDVPWAEWRQNESGGWEVYVRAPSAEVTVSIAAKVTFGGSTFTWEAGSAELAALEERTFPVPIPKAAMLHELAGTYLTDLVVRVHTADPTGDSYDDNVLLGAFVAWPDGPAGAPVVWSKEDAGRLAPHGVLDPEIQALAAQIAPNARVLPPVFASISERPPEIDLTGQNDPIPEPDDNTDEEDL